MHIKNIFYIVMCAICALSLVGTTHTMRNITITNVSVRELALVIDTMNVALPRTAVEQPLVTAPDIDASESDTTVEPEPAVEEVSTPPTLTADTLPQQVHLSVPFTSQAPEKNWEQPWQDACEEAAILMLDAYYKGYNISPLFARDEIIKQVSWQDAKGWGGSIDIIDVRSAAAWYLQVPESELTIIRYPEVAEIKTQLANGSPVLAVADGKVLPNPYFTGDGPVYHALVIIGYDDSTGEFITNDPGTQFGKDLRYSYADLIGALRDWNGGDVADGIPVVLVKK